MRRDDSQPLRPIAVPLAVADVLLADAAALRRLARRLLGETEADDLVQEASVAALAQGARPRRNLRHWLRGTVHKLAAMARRGHARRVAREQRATVPEAVPLDPAAIAMQAELVRDIGAAVHALDEPFRTTVLLRFWHDLPVATIAQRMGVPANTVRSRLQRGLARLRGRLDHEHGDRRHWVSALAVLSPWRASVFAISGFLLMKKVLLAVAAVLLVAFAIPWLLRDPAAPPPASSPSDSPVVMAQKKPPPISGEWLASRRETVPVAEPEAATTGALLVHVLYAEEPKAGAGITVYLGREDEDFRVGLPRAVTDAAGTARFEGLPAGSWIVRSQMGGAVRAKVVAGASADCTLRLDGATVTGVVVDRAGVGVAGALVERGQSAERSNDAEVVAVTVADGSFVVRNIQVNSLLGARAAGYAASQLYSLFRDPGVVTTLRIELLDAGGSVQGTVVAADGRPVRDAVVRVGEGKVDALRSTPQGAPPLPAQVRTDADGRFLAVGVPVGTRPVQVRAVGLAPWQGTCDMVAGVVANVQVRLDAGVTCTGVVRNEAGEPVKDAIVRSGRNGEFLQYFARTAADGAFTLRGLPAGEVEVWASSPPHGKASAQVRGEPGASVRCELVLSNGLTLRGVVTDEEGKPLSAEIECEATGRPYFGQSVFTDASGRFLVPECPRGRLLRVTAMARNRVLAERTGVDPAAGELSLQLPLDTSPRVHITGRVLGPDAQRVVGVSVRASCGRLMHQGADKDVESDDGTFDLEAAAGTWAVRIHADGHPTVFAGSRPLEPGAAWDLGTIRLAQGGTLVVDDGGDKTLDFLVLDAHEQFRCGLYGPRSPLRSELLAPGDHLLLVRGKGIAAHVIPFTIRSGEETELALRPSAGVRQQFEFMPEPGAELPRWISLIVRRDGKLVARCDEDGGHQTARTAQIWLEPGDYTVAPSVAEREGAATTVHVGREEGPVVRITVR